MLVISDLFLLLGHLRMSLPTQSGKQFTVGSRLWNSALHCYFLTDKHWAQVRFGFTRDQLELRDTKTWCLKHAQKSFSKVWKVTRLNSQMPCRYSNVQAYTDKNTSLYFRKIFWETKCACNYFLHLFPPHVNFLFLKEMEKEYLSLHQFFDTLQYHLSLYCSNNIDSKPSMKHVGGCGKNFFQKTHGKYWRISFWGRSTEKMELRWFKWKHQTEYRGWTSARIAGIYILYICIYIW